MASGTGTAPALTRERVVDAAIALVEREGLAELSMRRLAAELGAGTMSLYNHVADKEDLYDAMVEHVLASVRVSPSDDWREVVAHWATDSRAALLDRIDLIPLVIAPQRLDHLGRISRAVAAATMQAGLEPRDAAVTVRVVGRYFAGAVLLDAPRLRANGVDRGKLDDTFAAGLRALLLGLAAEFARVILDDQQVAGYEEHGYLVLRGALDPDRVSEVVAWVDEVAAWAMQAGPGLHHFEQTDDGPALARSEDLIGHHDGLRSLLSEGLVPELAGALLGEPAALYKEKVNHKQPGGAGFAPHQDAPAYRFVDFHVSCMVPLDPATEASGCLWVADGRPREVLAMDGLRGLTDEVVSSLRWHPVEVQPGDLLWFDSYVPHRSGTNVTDVARRALYLTYNAASAGDFRTTYYEDKEATFAGLDGEADRARLSITDDFLGRPVA